MDNHTGDSLSAVRGGPQEWAAAVKCVTLLTILVMTLTSNFFVLWAVLLRRRSHSGTGGLTRSGSLSRVQLFMVHLSIADILVALLNITPQLAWVITVDFRGGVILCKLITYAQVLVLYLSTYILTGMSLDRLISMRAIYAQWQSGMRTSSNSTGSPSDTSISSGPHATNCVGTSTKSRFNNHHSRAGYRKIAKVLIAVAWLLASMLALPQLYIFSYVKIRDDQQDHAVDDKLNGVGESPANASSEGRFNCLANFTWHPYGIQIYVTSFVVIILGVPVVLMLFSYGYMCVIILRIQRGYESDQSQLLTACHTTGGANGGFAASSERLTAAKVRLVKMTFAVVLCFVVCWSPFCIAELVNAYSPHDKGNGDHASPLLLVCLLLASLNSAVNPWIYAAFNATGRGNPRKRQDKSMNSDITSAQSTRVYSIQVPMSRISNNC